MANVIRLGSGGSSSMEIKYLGVLKTTDTSRWSWSKKVTLNVKNLLPNDYSKLTINNFIIPKGLKTYVYAPQADYADKRALALSVGTPTYNNETGVLSVSCSNDANRTQSQDFSIPVYVVLGDVERT